MKRTRIDLEQIACFECMSSAAYKAAKGKTGREAVLRFFANFEANISRLCRDVLQGHAPYGEYSTFLVRDVKQRQIHAACFEDRVVHHAIMAHVAPVLDRYLVPTAFACRVGLGPHKGIEQVQRGMQRYPWYVKIDIEKYFASIDQNVLLRLLKRRIKGSVWDVLLRILCSYETAPGKGLPIGALTSQHFANFYVTCFDRFLLEKVHVLHHARYMDDVIWWCATRQEAKSSLSAAKNFLRNELKLALNSRVVQINRSANGVTFCGARILPGKLLLTPRVKKRYSRFRKQYEQDWQAGKISSLQLQTCYTPLYAVCHLADSLKWRQQELKHAPGVDA